MKCHGCMQAANSTVLQALPRKPSNAMPATASTPAGNTVRARDTALTKKSGGFTKEKECGRGGGGEEKLRTLSLFHSKTCTH
eukprot:7348998-Lingulodinium_polyedra.AAC.1